MSWFDALAIKHPRLRWNIVVTNELIRPVLQLERNLNEIENRVGRMRGRYCIRCNGANTHCKIRTKQQRRQQRRSE
jgi:hypothetical protein